MRWEGQVVGGTDDGALPGLALSGLLRSVRTPDFAGVTFHEVAAKSALNKVPAASRVPFRWTINPMRGCLHACTYCLSGETLILMADGRARRLDEVAVGDVVIGTVQDGTYRRYVRSTVRAHWQTRKRAYRVSLRDGTTLVASGDHRFLTERGWKHVTGSGSGAGQRPHLTLNNSLMGFGQMVEPEKVDDEYRRGYLTGMVRGDGNLARYTNGTPGREGQRLDRFRLALVDEEALERSASYLDSFSVPTRRFSFSAASPTRRPLSAIRASSQSAFRRIGELIAWPAEPTRAWHRGFLAGIFDAEGCSSGGVVRISNRDPVILSAIETSMDVLGFAHRFEDHGRADRVCTIRLLGGLSARMRFFGTVDPAITRKRLIDGVAVKNDTPLDVTGIEDLGFDMPMVDITTDTGDFVANGVISHNCFARPTHEYLDLDAGKDFETQIVVKTNVVEVLQAELSRPSWRGEHVALGTNTDPYQRAEGRYRLMPGIIEALAGSGTPLSVLTKGTLLRRDLPLLSAASTSVPVSVAISLAVVDEELQAAVEPGTPTPRARLELIKAVRDAGLTCGVLVAPVMPYLTDSVEHLDDLLSRLAQAGATSATILPLHLRGSVKPWFFRWLAEAHPRLVAPYRRLYGSGAYLPAEYTQWLHARVDPLIDRYGFARGSGLQGSGGSGSSGPAEGVGTRFGHRGAAARGTSPRAGRRQGTLQELPEAVGAVGPQGTLF